MKKIIGSLLVFAICVTTAFSQTQTTTGSVVFGPASLTTGQASIGIGFDSERLTDFFPIPGGNTADGAKWYASKFTLGTALTLNQIGLSVQSCGDLTPGRVWVGIYLYTGSPSAPLGAAQVALAEVLTLPFVKSALRDKSVGLLKAPARSKNTFPMQAGPGVADYWYSSVFASKNLSAGQYLLVVGAASTPGGAAESQSFSVLNTRESSDGSVNFSNSGNGTGAWRQEAGHGILFHLINGTVPPTVTFTGTVNLLGYMGVSLPIVTVTVDGSPTTKTLTGSGSSGTFTVTLPSTGSHTVMVKAAMTLSKTLVGNTPAFNSGTFNLQCGDNNGDNKIDDLDFLRVINNFGSTDPVNKLLGDGNGDDKTDDLDFLLVINNFGSIGN